MAEIIKNKLYIYSALELEEEMCRYNCLTAEELEQALWDNYQITIEYKY